MASFPNLSKFIFLPSFHFFSGVNPFIALTAQITRNNMNRQGTAPARVSFVILTHNHKNGGRSWVSEEAWIFQPVQPHMTLVVAPHPSRSTSQLGSRNTWIHLAELCLHLGRRNNQGETDGCARPAPSHVIFQSNEQQCSLFSCQGAATPGGELWHQCLEKTIWERHCDLQKVVSAASWNWQRFSLYFTDINKLIDRFLCQLKKWSYEL